MREGPWGRLPGAPAPQHPNTPPSLSTAPRVGLLRRPRDGTRLLPVFSHLNPQAQGDTKPRDSDCFTKGPEVVDVSHAPKRETSKRHWAERWVKNYPPPSYPRTFLHVSPLSYKGI